MLRSQSLVEINSATARQMSAWLISNNLNSSKCLVLYCQIGGDWSIQTPVLNHRCDNQTSFMTDMNPLSPEELLAQHAQGKRDFQFTNLSGAYLFEANLAQSDLSNSDFSNAHSPYANFTQSNLANTTFNYAELGDCQFYQSCLISAALQGANLTRSSLRFADLSQANLSYANLQSADLRNANLSGCDLSYANLSGAILGGANLAGANLDGANFFRASNVDFAGARVASNTVFPDGHRQTDSE
jgi:uncharacterized protein YjbI with pentapeptide repeats